MSITQVVKEFHKSRVPARLTLANVQWVEGDAAVELLTETAIAAVQSVTSYATRPARRILDKYWFAKAGCWVAYGCTVEGDRGEVALAKPVNPRQAQDFRGFGAEPKLKTVKYETPEKCPALPMLPWVDEETALAIYNRYEATPEPGENFWQVVLRCNLPIVITEGFKKALSLIAHGLPAIAVRGVTQWRVKGTDDLHPIIEQFACDGRKFYVCFDQDEKFKTQIQVRGQTKKLAQAIEKAGCKSFILAWDGELGKGIDDVLYGQSGSAQAWLNAVVENAMTLKEFIREGAAAAAIATIKRLSQSKYPVERSTEGEYLPELSPLHQGAIHVVSATMNSGKTVRIGADWVGEAKRLGWFVLVLSPLNSLGKQTAQNWNLPHIHDFGTKPTEQQALWSMVAHECGIVMCPDSLPRLPNWVMQKPILLVLDEANQVVDHMATGATLGDRWSAIFEQFADIAAHAAQTGAIVLSEDGLPDRAIDLMKAASGAETVRVIKHQKQGEPWGCLVYNGNVSGFRGHLLQKVYNEGHRILFVSSSQQECRRMEYALNKYSPAGVDPDELVRRREQEVKGLEALIEELEKEQPRQEEKIDRAKQTLETLQKFPPTQGVRTGDLKVVRIDSETNQSGAFNKFFANPDQWLKDNQPDVLILSPSAKSGVSIEGNVSRENAYFKAVYGYFPTLDTDSHMQLLGRYRPSVPRIIFTPKFIQSGAEESLYTPRAIVRQWNFNCEALSKVFEAQELRNEPDAAPSERHTAIEAAALEYLAESLTISGARKAIAHDALIARLESAGHRVIAKKAEKHQGMVDLWKEARQSVWAEDSKELASAEVNDEVHTPKWAGDIRQSLEASKEDRVIASKVLLREEFPGITFDDANDCLEAIYTDDGAMRRGVSLQARSENTDAAKERDRGAAHAILGKKVRALHRLPKNYVRALIVSKTGILSLLDGNAYSNTDERAIAIKDAALKFAKEISYWLRLTINDTQTPVEICNKLLKKLGLEGKAIGRPGKRGEQLNRVYEVTGLDNPVRQRLLDAARRKLSESVSTTRIRYDQSHLQIMDTPQKPPLIGEWARPGALDEAREMVAAAAGDAETLEYLKSITPSEVWEAIAA